MPSVELSPTPPVSNFQSNLLCLKIQNFVMIKMCFSTLHTAEWLKWSQGLNCVTHISNPASSSSLKCYFYTFFLRKSYVAQTDPELVTANLNFWSSFLYFLHPGIKTVNHHAQFMQRACRQNPGLCTSWTSTLPFNWEREWEYVSLHVWLPTYQNMEIRRQLLAVGFLFPRGTEDWT